MPFPLPTSHFQTNFPFLITSLLKSLLDLVFPPRCFICKQLSNNLVCIQCQANLKLWPDEKSIVTSGKEVEPLDKVFSFFPYEDPLKKALHLLKFEKQKHLFPWFNKILLWQLKKNRFNFNGFDLITAVPLAWKRFKERGFNQAEILARTISNNYNLPYQETILRTKETRPQFDLKKQERIENLKNAFTPAPGFEAAHKKILLIDDIYTTGTTLKECAKVLRQAGAAVVVGITLSRAL